MFDKFLKRKLDVNLDKNYFTWGKGAGAELATMKSLEQLGVEYKRIYDLGNSRGNIDSLCVGPTGIYVVETKAHKGLISWKGRLLRNGREFEKDFMRQTHAEVYYVKDILKEKFNKDFKVQGVLEFPNGRIDKNSIRGKIKGVWIGGRGFARWIVLKKVSHHLDSEEIEKINRYLCELKHENKQKWRCHVLNLDFLTIKQEKTREIK